MKEKHSGPPESQTEGADEALSSTDKRRITDQIGRQLRGMYDGLLNQPVPDRFMELVSRLETDDQRKRKQ